MTSKRRTFLTKMKLYTSFEETVENLDSVVAIVGVSVDDSTEFWVCRNAIEVDHVRKVFKDAKIIMPLPSIRDVEAFSEKHGLHFMPSIRPHPFVKGRGVK